MRRVLWLIGLGWIEDAVRERREAETLWAGVDKERKTPSGAPWAPGAIAWASGFGSPLLVALAAFVIVNLLLLLLLSRFIETRAQRAEVANLALRDSFP